MPLPPALAKKLATRGILTENEGKLYTKNVLLYYNNIFWTLFKNDYLCVCTISYIHSLHDCWMSFFILNA